MIIGHSGFVYIVHFDEPLSHAHHYAGCTRDILGRLARHASGNGARIIEALMQEGKEWRLGALGACTLKEMRALERQLKRMKNTARYCEICSGESARISGTTPYPIAALPFVAESIALRRYLDSDATIEYCVSSCERIEYILGGITNLMRQNREELGFLPVSGDCGMRGCAERGQVIYAQQGCMIIGYVVYTHSSEYVTIHQCVVKDSHRGGGIGRELVRHVKAHAEALRIKVKCSVRDDLPANEFWQAIGFRKLSEIKHATSGNILNVYSTEEGNRNGQVLH